ncbi:hypothetical protein [Nevskia ramosa]|uniref:hypothetical protein n=1 Tax=Nevskia ramosa TaxID=64002 RepID=UPI0023567FA6|nr:hypothetical protein [Nevskia ramosa]
MSAIELDSALPRHARGLPRFDRWSAISIVCFCLALIPVIAIPVPGSSSAFAAGADHISFVDLFGLPLLLLLLYRARLPDSMTLLFAASFLGCAWISMVNVGDLGRETLRVLRLCFIYAPFLLALSLHWTIESAERALRVFWWGGLFGIVIGFFIYWFVGAVREQQQALFLKNGLGYVFRAGGQLGNSGGFSHLITSWAMTALALYWIALRRLNAVQIAVTLAVLVYGIVITASRNSLLQVGLVLMFTTLFVARSHQRSAGRVMVTLGLVVAVVVALLPLIALITDSAVLSATMSRFGLGEDDRSIAHSVRYQNWAGLLDQLGWNALGIGYKQTMELTGLPVDNSYLRIFLELGVAGITFFLLFWASIQLRLLGSRSPDVMVRRYKAAAAGLVMGELGRMCFSDTFTMYLSTPSVMVIMAIALRLRSSDASA